MSQVNFATTSVYSLLDFYSEQQLWVMSQLDQASSSASCSAAASPTPSQTPTLSTSTSITRSSSSSSTCSSSSSSSSKKARGLVPFGRRHSRRPPPRNPIHTATKWLPPALRRAHHNHAITRRKVRPTTTRIHLRMRMRMRTVTISRSKPMSMVEKIALFPTTTASPLPAMSVPLPRSPSPEATDLLVMYRSMIGDRMESCMRLQQMIDEARVLY